MAPSTTPIRRTALAALAKSFSTQQSPTRPSTRSTAPSNLKSTYPDVSPPPTLTSCLSPPHRRRRSPFKKSVKFQAGTKRGPSQSTKPKPSCVSSSSCANDGDDEMDTSPDEEDEQVMVDEAGEAWVQRQTATGCKHDFSKLSFPDQNTLAMSAYYRVDITLRGDRGPLSEPEYKLIRVNSTKHRQPCYDHVFVTTLQKLQARAEAGRPSASLARIVSIIDTECDYWVIKKVLRSLYRKKETPPSEPLLVLSATSQPQVQAGSHRDEDVYCHGGADNHMITNANFFLPERDCKARKIGPQFIQQALNPVRTGSFDMLRAF